MYKYTNLINRSNTVGYIYLIKYFDLSFNNSLIIGITNNPEQTKIEYTRNGRIDSRFFYTTGNVLNQLNFILTICKPYITIGSNNYKINLDYRILFNITNSTIYLSNMNALPYLPKNNSLKKLKNQRKNINPKIWNHLCIMLDKEFPDIMFHPMEIDDIENNYDETYLDSFIRDFK